MSNLQTLTNNNASQNPFTGQYGTGIVKMYATSGTYTFTVPTAITSVRVRVWGGGGGGASGAGANNRGGGGGGFAMKTITGLTPGASITVTVGSQGLANTGDSAGTSGGTSSFGAYVSATGGSGGTNSNSTGGSGSSGDINYTEIGRAHV